MNVLVYGDTQTSPAMRHEVPISIGDPFLYLESGDRRAVLTNALEVDRIARDVPELERLLGDEFGRDELIGSGRSPGEIDRELCARAVEAFGIRQAVVPPEFPLALGDRLREAGVELTPDEGQFTERRRRKSSAEMAGIRRAADAALAAMTEAAAMLRAAQIDGDRLLLHGDQLTAEAVRERIREVCARAGAPAPADIMIKPMGPNPAGGHDPGAGPLFAHLPIEIDLWPRDERSGCWADMTRAFVRGEISDPIAEIHALVLDAHERTCAAVKPGIPGADLYAIACDVFEAAGHPTGRSKAPGEILREGFFFGLGHGVGLEVHEAPALGRSGRSPLIVGDVIAVEPGTSVKAIGGTRVEDLLVVTDDGSERLTGSFPYGLVP
ncbi:MAG TPA: M24 family metallopeptidase [Solirubrobacteraceae bacterium]|jgi:Xaa-Pro aminopeptidase